MNNETRHLKGVGRILAGITAGILVLLPFHAFLTTWLGAIFGYIDAFRIWKELLVFALAPAALLLTYTAPVLRHWIKRDVLIVLILAYALLTVGSGIFAFKTGAVTSEALIYALLNNLRYFGFFAVVLVAAALSPKLRMRWHRIVFIPAGVVIGFALLQLLVLPADFLAHFGYGPDTIPAFQLVDRKEDFVRLQSTMRGANPFGVYIILILCLAAGGLFKYRGRKRILYTTATIAMGTVLFFTYSRSAMLGAVAALGVLAWFTFTHPTLRRFMMIGAVVGCLATLSLIWIFRDNNFVQNTVFHTNEASLSAQSSNEVRASALQAGINDITKEPFGRGPGTAGPASYRNNQPARISENYYIQLAQEVGLIGLGIFVAINGLAAWRLYDRRSDWLALGLLASLVGITLTNMLSHAWADDTISMLWWGLAGIALAPRPDILKRKESTHD